MEYFKYISPSISPFFNSAFHIACPHILQRRKRKNQNGKLIGACWQKDHPVRQNKKRPKSLLYQGFEPLLVDDL